MRNEALIIILLSLVFIIPAVSAELFISQPENLYNLGDEFNISITINPLVDSNEFLISKMICGSGEIELYKSAKSVKAGEQESVMIKVNLDSSLLGNVSGECYVSASYGGDQATSQKFDIVKEVNLNIDLSVASISPGGSFTVTGEALKKNGELLNGFAEISISQINLSLLSGITAGKFAFTITVPKNSPAGDYDVKVRAYEKAASGNIVNEGEASRNIKINQIVERVDVTLVSSSISPGNEASYKVNLFDQSGKEVSDDVIVFIYDPNKKLLGKKVVKSGVQNGIQTLANSTPGFWKIEATYNEIKASGVFDIAVVQSASFSVVNGTLIVVNTGNVPYVKPIEILVGGKSDVKKMSIGVGGKDSVKLNSPNGGENGTYSVQVIENNNTQQLGDQYFPGTGNTVVENLSRGSIWIWIILIVILILLALYYYKKVRKKSYLGASPKASGPIKVNAEESKSASVIDKGEKQNAAIISLKIKNMKDIEKSNTNAIESINNALQKAKQAKAKIYADGNYKLMIFAPLITKSEENNLNAVKVARDIKSSLDDHNKRFAQKIDYGIGVHVGDLAVEAKDGQFRFSSLGNTIPITKKIAESSSTEVLMSGQLHTKLMGSVKSDRVGESSFWQVRSVVERGEHSGFIKGFLKRQTK